MSLPQVPEITLEEAKKRLEEGQSLFLDVRDGDSYEQAHIQAAQHLNNENLGTFLEQSDKSQPVVVYCYHGNSSKAATQLLLQKGFQDVVSMQGGFEAWRQLYETQS